MAQNAQRRSQPEAIFSGAQGRPSSRRRTTRGPLAGATPAGRSGDASAAASPWPGSGDARTLPLGRAERQQGAPVARHVRARPARRAGSRPGARDVGVGVEAEHRVGLGQLVGQLLAVPLGQAADRDHGAGPAGLLQRGGREQRVDRVLLGLLDEAAGVDHGDVGVGRVVDQRASPRPRAGRPAPRSRPRCARSPASRGRRCGRGSRRQLLGRRRTAPPVAGRATRRRLRRRRPAGSPGGSSPRSSASVSGRSSGLTSTSRALEPSHGPTIPRDSIRSISRPALAKPTRSLRCSIEVEPNWVDTTSSAACSSRSRSSPMSSSISLLLRPAAATSSR